MPELTLRERYDFQRWIIDDWVHKRMVFLKVFIRLMISV